MFLLGHVISGRAVQSLSTGVKLIVSYLLIFLKKLQTIFVLALFRLLLQCENQSTPILVTTLRVTTAVLM